MLAGGVFNELELFTKKLIAIDKKNSNQYDFVGAYSLPVGGAALAALRLPYNEAKLFIDQYNASMKKFLTN